MLLPAWQESPLDDLLEMARDLVEDTTFPTVRRWREDGGRVLGHFQVYFPEELAHAGGLLPVRIRGAPVDPRQAEARFGSYLCSILKTSLELALSGRLELDLFVSHPICDAARNLAAVWERNCAYPCGMLYLPQNTGSRHAAGYLATEYARVLGLIESLTGDRVSDEALWRSIDVFNDNRRLLRALYDVRRREPWRLSVEESYVLVALGGLVPRDEHNALLARVLRLLETRPAWPQDRLRVVFEGGFCEQPPLDMLRTIGQSCYVVDDDLLIGLRWIEDDVGRAGDPLQALARAGLERSSYSPVQRDARRPKEERLLARIREANAAAAILAAAKMCEPGLDEQVAYVSALDAAGVPCFVTEFEEGMTAFDQVQLQLETFVENVLFA